MKKLIPIFLLLIASHANGVDSTSPPATEPAKPPVVEVQVDGSLLMKADGARIIGYKMHLEHTPVPTLVHWVDSRESAEWPTAIAHKGKYAVEITYACPPGAGGGFTISAGANKIDSHTQETADWKTFRTEKLDRTLTVLNDNTSLVLRSPNWINGVLLSCRSIKLTPLPDEGKDKKN